ncbi:MAG: endolytic transglycosylase MltG [Erysipelotrichaceae bacterium]|nr:endolytic transglycosylase MltG [Erysipelotrichaceae bacterium]
MAKSNKKMKLSHIVIIIVLLIAVAGGGGLIYLKSGLSAVSKDSEEVIVSVSDGDYVGLVLQRMNEAGLVKNMFAAKVYAKLNKKVLKSNNYRLNKNMSLPEMMTIMEKGDTKYIVYKKFTVTEGSRIPDVAKRVAKLVGTTKKKVLAKWSDKTYLKSLSEKYDFLDYKTITKSGIKYPLEGYLYPETYYLDSTEPTVESITDTMLKQTGAVLNNYLSKTDFSAHEILTLASIVEQETLFDKDLPIIAGVFMNRLKDDMPLQSDITVNYALDRTGVDVSYAMTQTDSPYNTYQFRGLPIGPVSCVSEKALKNTINYQKHKYYYFFAKKDGKVIYSKTLSEHNKAINKYKWY